MRRALVMILLLTVSSAVQAATLRVPADYATIQAAIDASAAGDTVLVAPGTYTDCDGGPCLPAVATLRSGLVLLSEGGEGVTTLNATGPTSTMVVDAIGIGSQGATVVGFKLTSDDGTRIGLNARDSIRLDVRACLFENLGAALGVNTISAADEVVVVGCTFRSCGGGTSAIQTHDIDTRIEECVFEDCVGPVVNVCGRERRTFVIRDSVFRNNDAQSGNVLASLDCVDATVERCVFLGNTGRGLIARANPVTSHALVRDCLFVGGSAAASRGAAGTSAGSGTVEYTMCTAVANFGVQAGAAFKLGASTSVFRNNIVAYTSGNAALDVAGVVDEVISSCNVFWGNSEGDFEDYIPDSTDRFVDPLFCDLEAEDFTLRALSPCLPAGSMGCGLIGAFGEGCGAVSVQPTTWGHLKSVYRTGGER